MHIKKGNKQTIFNAYSDEEKESYSLKVWPLGDSASAADEPGSRPLTVMDDFLQSIRYVEKLAQDLIFFGGWELS